MDKHDIEKLFDTYGVFNSPAQASSYEDFTKKVAYTNCDVFIHKSTTMPSGSEPIIGRAEVNSKPYSNTKGIVFYTTGLGSFGILKEDVIAVQELELVNNIATAYNVFTYNSFYMTVSAYRFLVIERSESTKTKPLTYDSVVRNDPQSLYRYEEALIKSKFSNNESWRNLYNDMLVLFKNLGKAVVKETTYTNTGVYTYTYNCTLLFKPDDMSIEYKKGAVLDKYSAARISSVCTLYALIIDDNIVGYRAKFASKNNSATYIYDFIDPKVINSELLDSMPIGRMSP